MGSVEGHCHGVNKVWLDGGSEESIHYSVQFFFPKVSGCLSISVRSSQIVPRQGHFFKRKQIRKNVPPNLAFPTSSQRRTNTMVSLASNKDTAAFSKGKNCSFSGPSTLSCWADFYLLSSSQALGRIIAWMNGPVLGSCPPTWYMIVAYGKRDPQLRNCLHQIGLYPNLESIILTNYWGRRAKLT